MKSKLGQLDAALTDAEAAHALAPDNPAVNDTVGWVLVQQDEPARALTYLRQARARASEDPSIRYHIATALARLGREKEALAELYYLLEDDEEFSEREDAEALQRQLE